MFLLFSNVYKIVITFYDLNILTPILLLRVGYFKTGVGKIFHFAAYFAEEIKKVQAEKAEEIKKLGSERVVELLRAQICLNEAKNELLHLTVKHAISGPTACRSFIEIFLKLAHRDLFADHTIY